MYECDTKQRNYYLIRVLLIDTTLKNKRRQIKIIKYERIKKAIKINFQNTENCVDSLVTLCTYLIILEIVHKKTITVL